MAATPRALDVLHVILLIHEQTGFMPTVRQIGDELGLSSPGTVHVHLSRLERERLIERRPGGHAYRVTDLGRTVAAVAA